MKQRKALAVILMTLSVLGGALPAFARETELLDDSFGRRAQRAQQVQSLRQFERGADRGGAHIELGDDHGGSGTEQGDDNGGGHGGGRGRGR